MRIDTMNGMQRAGYRIWVAAGSLVLPLLAVLALSAPAVALDEIAIGAEPSTRGPTPSERLEAVRTEQKALEQKAKELAEREAALEREAERARQEAKVACPPLVRVKYPWLTCSTNAWGVKTINATAGKSSGASGRLLLGDAASAGDDPLWGLKDALIR